jgi:murein DD-endopeptidase MepM/ murein hydrolase activator NlpD
LLFRLFPEGRAGLRKRIHAYRRIALLAVVAGSLLAVSAVPVGATSYSQRQDQLQQLIRQKEARLHTLNHQAQDLVGQIQSSDVRLAQIQRSLDSLSAQLAAARDTLSQIDAQLNVLTAALQDKTSQLESALGTLADQRAAMNRRVAEIYMGAPTTYQEALSAASDFADVITANQYASSVVRSDQETVKRLQDAEALIESQRNDISAQQSELVTQRNAAAAQAQKIADLEQQMASVRSAQTSERAHQAYLLRLVNRQRHSYVDAIQQLRVESASITALLRGLQSGQRVIQGVGGYLKWPVSGPITSPFGWRIHPIYHYRSFHTGIDIGVAEGTTVKVARYGKVVFTGWDGAYGLIVIVDHGNSLATVYAHLSRVFVRVGQRVRTLQSIAASGNTGWSTGPHLHFEVRLQGTPVNPISWL